MAALPFLLLVAFSLLSVPSLGSGAAGALCPRTEPAFLYALSSHCPIWIKPSPPIEVNGEILETELSNAQRDAYYSVFFYASWCPFSRIMRPMFDSLSLMFPQIRHLAVEESSVMPIDFSRYRVHSFPTILIISKGKIMVHFNGPKDISSLLRFYNEITGLDALSDDFGIEQSEKAVNLKPVTVSSSVNVFSREMIANEPYVALGSLFLCLKALVICSPKILSLLKAFWRSHRRYLNVGIFRERSQLLERALHVMDVRKRWSSLKLCNKSRNFQKGAKNARVWASSLASVSLGESSSSPRAGTSSS